MNRRSIKLNVEQLEDRLNPTALIWDPNPLFEPNFSNANNWLNPATDLPPPAPPGINDDLYFTGVAKPCFLDANFTVNSLTIDPQQANPETFVLHMLNSTLRVQNSNAFTNRFLFKGGTILFNGPVGHLVVENCSKFEWFNEADILGGMGALELRNSSLKLIGNGRKQVETSVQLGFSSDQGNSYVFVTPTASGSFDLGLSGRLIVSSKGSLDFENNNDFSITVTEENPYRLDLDGKITHLANGTTTINVGILMDAPTSEIRNLKGTLIVNDPNNVLSVDQVNGQVVLSPGSIFEVRDGFLQNGGSFTLAGNGLLNANDVFATSGDFYFNSQVSLIQNITNPRSIEWSNITGKIVFGDDNVLTMNTSGFVGAVDSIVSAETVIGGKLNVNENSLVGVGVRFDLIGGKGGNLTGEFEDLICNGNPLLNTWKINNNVSPEGVRFFQLEKI